MNNKQEFILCIAFLLCGLLMFEVGFHNVDLCENEYKIQCKYNEKYSIQSVLSEKTIGGIQMSLDNCYLLGIGLMNLSLGFFGVGFFFSGHLYSKI